METQVKIAWWSILVALAINCHLGAAQNSVTVLPPSELRVLSAQARFIFISMTPSLTSGVTYKLIFKSVNINVTKTVFDSQSASFLNIAGLCPDVDYRIEAYAILNDVFSSPAIAYATTKPDVPTGPPTNIRVISRGPTVVTIEWNDPLSEDINDRDGIILYHIKLNGSNVGSTSERMFTLTNLQPGRTQHIQIIPVNDQGKAKEQFAGEISAIAKAGVPGSPTIRYVLPKFNTATIKWDPPTFVGEVLAYQLEYMVDDAMFDNTILSGNELAAYKYILGLSSKVDLVHSVRVRAKTSPGWGNYSQPVTFIFKQIASMEIKQRSCNSVIVEYKILPLPACNYSTLSEVLMDFTLSYKINHHDNETIYRIPLNGVPGIGQMCIQDLDVHQEYLFEYDVAVNTSVSITLPFDIQEKPLVLPTCVNSADQLDDCLDYHISGDNDCRFPVITEKENSQTSKISTSTSSVEIHASSIEIPNVIASVKESVKVPSVTTSSVKTTETRTETRAETSTITQTSTLFDTITTTSISISLTTATITVTFTPPTVTSTATSVSTLSTTTTATVTSTPSAITLTTTSVSISPTTTTRHITTTKTLSTTVTPPTVTKTVSKTTTSVSVLTSSCSDQLSISISYISLTETVTQKQNVTVTLDPSTTTSTKTVSKNLTVTVTPPTTTIVETSTSTSISPVVITEISTAAATLYSSCPLQTSSNTACSPSTSILTSTVTATKSQPCTASTSCPSVPLVRTTTITESSACPTPSIPTVTKNDDGKCSSALNIRISLVVMMMMMSLMVLLHLI